VLEYVLIVQEVGNAAVDSDGTEISVSVLVIVFDYGQHNSLHFEEF